MDDDYDVTDTLVAALEREGALATPVDGDIRVEWYLSEIMEFCREWRSEIEELG